MKKFLKTILLCVAFISIINISNMPTYAYDYYETESNDTYASANNIGVNDSVSGNIQSYDDEDFYKIVAPANGKITLWFEHVYQDSNNRWYVGIYKYGNGEYTQLTGWNISLKDNEKICLPYIGAVKGGVYYVRISCYYGNLEGIPYTIKTAFTSSNYYEKEDNDVYSSATPMELNKSYNGTINGGGDVDFYKIVSPATGEIKLTFRHTYDESAGWRIYTYRYVNGTYIPLSENTVYANESGTVTLLKSREYKNGILYVKVCDYEGLEGVNYSIKSSFTLNKRTNLRLSNASISNIRISWNKISGADGYQLMWNKSGKWRTVNISTKNLYTMKGLKSGTVCKFRIRGVDKILGKTFYGEWSDILVVSTKPSATTIRKLIPDGRHQITAKWKKISNCTGYVIQFSNDSNFKKIIRSKRLFNNSTTSYTGSQFLKGKKYYVRVRAFKIVERKIYYSSWSKVKMIRSK